MVNKPFWRWKTYLGPPDRHVVYKCWHGQIKIVSVDWTKFKCFRWRENMFQQLQTAQTLTFISAINITHFSLLILRKIFLSFHFSNTINFCNTQYLAFEDIKMCMNCQHHDRHTSITYQGTSLPSAQFLHMSYIWQINIFLLIWEKKSSFKKAKF